MSSKNYWKNKHILNNCASLHHSQPEALAHFQHNTENLSCQYETVLRHDVDERDQGTCERIISGAESLLNDEVRLLSLSVSHRRYLHVNLRRAIVQVRSILQETVDMILLNF